jgi:Tfp pilus assembly protein PilE
MSEEFETVETTDEPSYSAFWPVLILVIGLLLWSGYQAYGAYVQSTNLTKALVAAQPTVQTAQNVQAKLYSVAQDLLQTSAKDNNAAQIVKENNIQINGPTNAADTAPDAGKPNP